MSDEGGRNDGQQDEEEWDSLPEILRNKIEQGIREADAGNGTPYEEVLASLRNKYKYNISG